MLTDFSNVPIFVFSHNPVTLIVKPSGPALASYSV
jgi:hypothetical protein